MEAKAGDVRERIGWLLFFIPNTKQGDELTVMTDELTKLSMERSPCTFSFHAICFNAICAY